MASPLIALYGFGVGGILPDISKQARLLPAPFAVLHLAATASNMAFFTLVIAMIFLRRMPVAKSKENILSGTFPDCAHYAARTWRLLPGLY